MRGSLLSVRLCGGDRRLFCTPVLQRKCNEVCKVEQEYVSTPITLAKHMRLDGDNDQRPLSLFLFIAPLTDVGALVDAELQDGVL